VERNLAEAVSDIEIQQAELRVAQPRGVRQHGLEYRFKLAGRARDDTEDLRGRGLLLQRLAQLVEQPGVLDGDDRLAREAGDQLDLLSAKRPHLLAVDDDGTHQFAVLEHWDGNHCPRTPNRGEQRPSKTRWHFKKTRLVEDICDVDCLLRSGKAAERSVGRRAIRSGQKFFCYSGCNAVRGNHAERVSLT